MILWAEWYRCVKELHAACSRKVSAMWMTLWNEYEIKCPFCFFVASKGIIIGSYRLQGGRGQNPDYG